jgi:hypothetical protein
MAKESLSPSVEKSAADTFKVAESAPKIGETMPGTGFQSTATNMANDIGLKLTPAHTEKLASVLDELVSKPDLSADAAQGAKSILNVSKMSTGEDVKATINRFGEVLGPIMKDAGWKESQTHIETLNLAEQLGLEPDVGGRDDLAAIGKSTADIPQTIVAGRMLLQTSAALFQAAESDNHG